MFRIFNKNIEPFPDNLVKNLITNCKTYSHDYLKKDFIAELFEDDELDFLIVIKDSNGAIRGYAGLAEYTTDDDQNDYLELKILCVAQRPSVTTRSNIKRLSGKHILEQTEIFGVREGMDWIQLNSIINAIPYYHRFGYDFKNGRYFSKRNANLVKILESEIKYYGSDEDVPECIISKFDRYSDEFYRIGTISSKNNWDIDDDFEDTLSVHRDTSRENGYLMIKYI